jgi:hypothetical protein
MQFSNLGLSKTSLGAGMERAEFRPSTTLEGLFLITISPAIEPANASAAIGMKRPTGLASPAADAGATGSEIRYDIEHPISHNQGTKNGTAEGFIDR